MAAKIFEERGYTSLRDVGRKKVVGLPSLAGQPASTIVSFYRIEAKVISRSGGRSTVGSASYRAGWSAVAASAYRHGAEIKDERTGIVHDYGRKGGVMGSEIMLPTNAPGWMRDRGQLWNAVEKVEKRADAQLARDYILSLPHELDAEQRRDLTREFVRQQFVDKGFVADIAWHAPHGKGDERNYHAHVMVVMRRIDGNGFARIKERAPDGKHPAEHWKNELRAWREAWANAGADALTTAGFDLESVRFRAGHLTIDKQREAALARGDRAWAEALDRETEPKQGPLATKIEREGRTSHAGDDRRDVQARNAERAQLREEHAQVTAKIIDLEQERRKRQGTPKVDNEPDDALKEETQFKLAERQATNYRTAEAAERMQEQEHGARKLREQAEQEAADAKRKEKQLQQEAADRAEAGDIADPRARWAMALGQNYSIRDPYNSLANAVMSEHGMFRRQQEELRKEAAAEKNPEKRHLIELRRDIEAHEYCALQCEKNAAISRAITRSDNPDAQRDDRWAKQYQDTANERRQERTELQREIRTHEADAGWAKVHEAIRQPDGSPPRTPDRSRGQPPREEAQRGHAGQQGARPAGNPGHLQTRSQREAAERRAAGQDTQPSDDARVRDRDTARQQREATDRRAGLQPNEPAEGKPQTKEGREQQQKEAARAWTSALSGRPAEGSRDKGHQPGRPTGRGGGKGR